ncbi:MAG TPA: hypothetical protein DCO79_06565, partial [Spirochaeta sp.]|nr:hypothetical protein [Spirochaeta sp.]
MKKITAVFLMLIMITAAVIADTDMDPQDFLYLTDFNQDVYPELDYETNPAFLRNLKDKLLLGSLYFDGSYDTETKTRIDDSVGATGGTETSVLLGLNPAADFVFFTPTKDKNIAGFGVNIESNHYFDTLTDIKYNGATENLQEKLSDNTFSVGADFYLAPKISKGPDAGFTIGYDFSHDPALYNWITDSTVSPAVSYTETLAEPDNTNDFSHGLDAAAGLVFPVSSGEFRLSVDYRGVFTDSSDEYVAVDTDLDGFNDSVMKLYNYLDLAPTGGGPVDNVTGKDFVHYTFSNDVNLNTGITWTFDKGKSVLLDVSWKAFGYLYEHYALHILTEDIDTDVSYLDTSYNSSLGSYDLSLAFDLLNKEKKTVLRIGAGYSHYEESLHREGDTDAGTMRFSSQNDGNYEELELGLNPENNSLVDSGIGPAEQLIHGVFVDACWRWTPEKKVTLLLDIGAAAYYDITTYRAFNLDTLTTWEETAAAANISCMLGSVAGISFPLGEKIKCMVDLNNIGFIGDFGFADETHMYDTDTLRYSDNGEGYLLGGFNVETT